MCFASKNKKIRVRTAKSDVVCYKYMDIVKNGLKSTIYFDGRIFKLGRRYKARNDGKFHGKTIVHIAEFSHTTVKELKPKRHSYLVFIDAGFHSYGIQRGCNVMCVIPKGVKYYYDSEDKHFVSTEIKFVKLIGK